MAAICFLKKVDYDALHFHMKSLKINIFKVLFWHGAGHKKSYSVYAFDNVDKSGRPLNRTSHRPHLEFPCFSAAGLVGCSSSVSVPLHLPAAGSAQLSPAVTEALWCRSDLPTLRADSARPGCCNRHLEHQGMLVTSPMEP